MKVGNMSQLLLNQRQWFLLAFFGFESFYWDASLNNIVRYENQRKIVKAKIYFQVSKISKCFKAPWKHCLCMETRLHFIIRLIDV